MSVVHFCSEELALVAAAAALAAEVEPNATIDHCSELLATYSQANTRAFNARYDENEPPLCSADIRRLAVCIYRDYRCPGTKRDVSPMLRRAAASASLLAYNADDMNQIEADALTSVLGAVLRTFAQGPR